MNIETLNAQFETASPQEILAWAAAHFMPNLAASSSFQTQSVALLHMIGTVCPDVPVIFIDTGYHFPETLRYRDDLIAALGINVRVVSANASPADLIDQAGRPLYARDPEMCCYINKVEPMQRATADLEAWISGIRRDQTANRAKAQFIEPKKSGQLKINPMLNVTERDLWRYISQHDLPAHPLFSQGYMSIGCAPCTRPVTDSEDARAGRWAGREKVECGLHTDAMNTPRHT